VAHSRFLDSAARAAIAAAAAGSLAHAAMLFSRFIVTDPALPLRIRLLIGSLTLTTAAALGGCLLALVLVARSWQHSGARHLALFLAAVATVWAALLRMLQLNITDRLHMQVTVGGALMYLLPFAIIVAAAAFVRFSATFPTTTTAASLPVPHRLRLLRRTRRALLDGRTLALVAALVFVVPIAAGLGLRVAEARLGISVADATRNWPGDLPAAMIVAFALTTLLRIFQFLVAPVAAMLIGAANLVAGYRRADAAARRRVLWLVSGAAAAVGMLTLPLVGAALIGAILPDGSTAARAVPVIVAMLIFSAPAVLVACTALAVFYSGAVDPRLVLERSTVYGILGAFGFVAFTTLESLLSAWVEASLGAPGLLGSVLAGCLAAGMLLPLRGALSRTVRRVLPAAQPVAATPTVETLTVAAGDTGAADSVVRGV
jgi:hypothetical protein